MFFINSRNKKINDKFLTLTKLALTILDKYCHSVNFFNCKTFIQEAHLEPSRKSTIKLFSDLLKEAPT